jgi:hypothetical protein
MINLEPVLAGLLQASVLGTSAVGDRAGQRLHRVLSDPVSGQRTGNLCFASRGFWLHAARREKAEHRVSHPTPTTQARAK